MENQPRIIRVFSKKVAVSLQRLGYEIVATEPNTNCTRLDVYIFKNVNGLTNDMDTIIKENERIKNI